MTNFVSWNKIFQRMEKSELASFPGLLHLQLNKARSIVSWTFVALCFCPFFQLPLCPSGVVCCSAILTAYVCADMETVSCGVLDVKQDMECLAFVVWMDVTHLIAHHPLMWGECAI